MFLVSLLAAPELPFTPDSIRAFSGHPLLLLGGGPLTQAAGPGAPRSSRSSLQQETRQRDTLIHSLINNPALLSRVVSLVGCLPPSPAPAWVSVVNNAQKNVWRRRPSPPHTQETRAESLISLVRYLQDDGFFHTVLWWWRSLSDSHTHD